MTTESHHRSWSYNYIRSCSRTQHQPFYRCLAFEANWKGEKVGASWTDHKSKKSSFLKCRLLLFYATTTNHFSIRLWHATKSGFYTTTGYDQFSGWTEKKLQSTSQSQWVSEFAQSCLTLCDPMDCRSLPRFTVHGIFQARALEWVAVSFYRGSSSPRDRTRVSHIGGRCFTIWATREVPNLHEKRKKKDHGHCLVVCCQYDLLQFSESWQNHYIWEVWSANQWDAPKAATSAAGIGQQKGPQQCLTKYCATNTSKVEWIELQSFASSAIFTWPLINWLPPLQASRQLFPEKILPTLAGGRKYFPRVHQITEHRFLCYRNKQTYFSLAKMCLL